VKTCIVFLLLLNSLGHVGNSTEDPNGRLRIELRTTANPVRLTDDLGVTVVFRSPEKGVTIWNALGWGSGVGLYLQVLDSSGSEVQNDFHPFYHALPPDETGKDALISISGSVFAGFDSQIPAKLLFPKAGTYMIKCVYQPLLSRHYFQGHTIWGREDGPIESTEVLVAVTE